MDDTLHHPRILCLHGMGANAGLFKSQSQSLIKCLRRHFRLIFADAPFLSPAGPGILPTNKSLAPFRSWIPCSEGIYEQLEEAEVISILRKSLRDAMDADDTAGATGKWVALMGFSQGARLCASLLWDQQMRSHHDNENNIWDFGILFAGSAPLVSFTGHGGGETKEGFVRITDTSSANFVQLPSPNFSPEIRLRVPTIHVHGFRDILLPNQKILMDNYCDERATTLVTWDGGHGVPVKTRDVVRVMDAILNIARTVACI